MPQASRPSFTWRSSFARRDLTAPAVTGVSRASSGASKTRVDGQAVFRAIAGRWRFHVTQHPFAVEWSQPGPGPTGNNISGSECSPARLVVPQCKVGFRDISHASAEYQSRLVARPVGSAVKAANKDAGNEVGHPKSKERSYCTVIQARHQLHSLNSRARLAGYGVHRRATRLTLACRGATSGLAGLIRACQGSSRLSHEFGWWQSQLGVSTIQTQQRRSAPCLSCSPTMKGFRCLRGCPRGLRARNISHHAHTISRRRTPLRAASLCVFKSSYPLSCGDTIQIT
jgi:hypothetical protein